jgi:hypothetical protein
MDRYHDGNGRLTGDQQPVLHAPVLLAAPSLSKPVGGGARFCLSVGRGVVCLSVGRGERLGLTSLRASTAPTAARSTHACR